MHIRSLVNLGKHGVGGLRDNSSSHTSNETGTQVDTSLSSRRKGALVDNRVGELNNPLINDELGHSVWDLLEEDGSEPRIEGANSLLGGNLAKSRDEAGSECGLGDETNTSSLKRAEGDIGEELGKSRRSEIDGSPVLGGSLYAEEVNGLGLEQFVTTELQGALEGISSNSGPETSEESTGTLISDHLAKTANHALVVNSRLQLDTSLDAVLC